ncbi:AlpA family transcriptional regulator [Hydrogenophaga pseudoflava]|uniref:AlpA family transcriptional regulator n=1 Tax=Hydrogenophaga pseudoflava TaxID=47421 RepID=UPI0027D79775|nr:AlpA family transcriptional regulator [Hydrogenophaga pseudoflava]
MLSPEGEDGTVWVDDGITTFFARTCSVHADRWITDARFEPESSIGTETLCSHSVGVASTGRRTVQHHNINPPQDQSAPPTAALLRMRAVMKITGLGRSTIYRLMASHEFPNPVRLASRAVAWRRADIDSWSQTRPTVAH